MYWYKSVNNKKVKFVGDELVGDNPIEYFKSPNIESWGHKDETGTIDLCFPEIWDVWDQEDLDGE